MSSKLPPVPYQGKIADPQSMIVTPIWADWFKQAFQRMGGHILVSSETASGYQQLPSGLVIQWGITASVTSATTQPVVFVSPFPSVCLQVMAGVRDNSAGATAATGHFGTGNYSVSGFDLYNRTSAAYVFNWLAVGF